MSSNELSKSYEPKAVEQAWYDYWLKKKYFHADENAGGRHFSIVIPPPNVTGQLHIGHALNSTIQDILVRWMRMSGRNTLWVTGTDHAGIATQNVVERKLAKENADRHVMGRDAFVEKVWEWKKEYGGRIIGQLKRLGASCDWDRERFTMDEGLWKAVREVFVRLYEEGLIYRGERLINWCPRCHTALSDIEVEHEDEKGKLYHIAYPLTDDHHIRLTVATTRPETMLGDTAVAVHPLDPRSKGLIGKTVSTGSGRLAGGFQSFWALREATSRRAFPFARRSSTFKVWVCTGIGALVNFGRLSSDIIPPAGSAGLCGSGSFTHFPLLER